ncbi:hypothetical protein SAMN05444372_110141 [Flavobacterium micromati]|uniref:Uncharacterized protein n=1 Tax=Flavobacterium micromati TaxID=229205 RepID=A0A1M5N5A3_9FLAO|nr:hypothetical protein [Flavobacterium micromati]SHG84173.1 hypothetical protein SAMN05444372_110141 [Flavobacterium micromati]
MCIAEAPPKGDRINIDLKISVTINKYNQIQLINATHRKRDEPNLSRIFQTAFQEFTILTGESANEILSENKN